MESNNRAWALSVSARSPAEDVEMLNCAHAAAWHWEFAGTELNHMRARMLLAEVHALLGNGRTAHTFARQMREYFLSHATPDWEIAFTHAVYAHACLAAGDRAAYLESYRLAEGAIAAIADREDREVVEQTFVLIPVPESGLVV